MSTVRRRKNASEGSSAAEQKVDPSYPPKTVSYKVTCPFFQPSDNVKFDNSLSIFEVIPHRLMHFVSRLFLQWGGIDTWNPLVKLPSMVLLFLDTLWSGIDLGFFFKRSQLFGSNYIACMSLCVSKYDPNAKAKDSIDGRLLAYPQRKSWRLGPFPVNPNTGFQTWGPKNDKAVHPLYISDAGATQNPALAADQPKHHQIRKMITSNLLGDEHIKPIVQRQHDAVSAKMLKAFGEEAKGLTDQAEIIKVLTKYLPSFLLYSTFDIDEELLPGLEEWIHDYCSDKFVLNMFVYGKIMPSSLLKTPMKKAIDTFVDFVMEHSKVLSGETKDLPPGMTKKELCYAVGQMFVVAAFCGTRDTTARCMTLMPKGYLEKVVDDPKKLRNAIYEVCRLHNPVPFSARIVDDDGGLTTLVGGKKLTFKKGTPYMMMFSNATVDSSRFENPYVFDPENRDFSKMTLFNSLGEKSDDPPHICPGREPSMDAVELFLKAKLAAEQAL